MTHQSGRVINPLSTVLPHLSVRKKDYSVHTELINKLIASFWNWGIYQWSRRMCNKEHKGKSNPFSLSFSSVLAEFLLLTNFLFRPTEMLLKTALKTKSWTIALLLDIRESKKFLNLLIKLSLIHVCSHPTTDDSRYPDSKVHGANMGPIWVLSAPGGPHVGPMNLVIRVSMCRIW